MCYMDRSAPPCIAYGAGGVVLRHRSELHYFFLFGLKCVVGSPHAVGLADCVSNSDQYWRTLGENTRVNVLVRCVSASIA